MKSTIGPLTRDKGRYTVQHFAAIRENGFRYYWSACEGVLLDFGGEWIRYDEVRKVVKSLPEVFYE